MHLLRNTIFLALLIATSSCRKCSDAPAPRVPPATPSAVLDDRSTVRLRSIEEPGTPAPFFSFTYDSAGYATNINFADGFFQYSVSYEHKRVKQMRNTPDGALLNYHYANGLVDAIHKTNNLGDTQWDYLFTYTQLGRLETVRWLRHTGNSSELARRVELSYDASGELAQWKDYYDVNGTLTWMNTFQYSDYDNGSNVDDFQLLKHFFDDLLYLPSVHIQHHNPRRLDILGAVNDFRIDYTYTYANGLPQQRTGIMQQTRGGSGAPITLHSSYTYF